MTVLSKVPTRAKYNPCFCEGSGWDKSALFSILCKTESGFRLRQFKCFITHTDVQGTFKVKRNIGVLYHLSLKHCIMLYP